MFEEKYINLNGREFRYLERQGVGCKLLFLHGLSDSADCPAPTNWTSLRVSIVG